MKRPPRPWWWLYACRCAERRAKGYELEDRTSVALIGAWQALQTYDAARGCSERTWVVWGIRVALWRYDRDVSDHMTRDQRTAAKRLLAAGEEVPPHWEKPGQLPWTDSDEDETFEPVDPALGPEALAVARLTARELYREIDTLPSVRERVAVRAWLAGATYPVIARRLGVSQSRVSQLMAQARGKLREQMEGQ